MFTNQIYMYDGEQRPRTGKFIDFQRAVYTNRTRLRTFLQEWERLSHGHIVAWKFDLIELEIERYDFVEDAIAF